MYTHTPAHLQWGLKLVNAQLIIIVAWSQTHNIKCQRSISRAGDNVLETAAVLNFISFYRLFRVFTTSRGKITTNV